MPFLKIVSYLLCLFIDNIYHRIFKKRQAKLIYIKSKRQKMLLLIILPNLLTKYAG